MTSLPESERALDLLEKARAALAYADPGLVVSDEIADLLRRHGRLAEDYCGPPMVDQLEALEPEE